MEENKKESFSFTYSAEEQEELKRIREKYRAPAPEAEDPMSRLRRLDRGVAKRAQTVAMIVGILGSLILGTGMSLVMTDLSLVLGSLRAYSLLLGIAVGVLGALLVSLAYPIYLAVLRRQRKKIAPEILRLTDELIR